MSYDIIIGRSQKDKEKYGTRGSILIGKQYVQMGQVTSLSNHIYLDVSTSHVILICGKRGGGKSYTLGVITEGVSDLPVEIKQNISVVIFDTMGVFWTMKYPNQKKDESELLKKWGFESKSLNVKIYTPVGYYAEYKKKGIPTDVPFSIKPSELSATDWSLTFGISENGEEGILIESVIHELQKTETEYSIDDIIELIKKQTDFDKPTIVSSINRFKNVKEWGLFGNEGTPLDSIIKGGEASIIDTSCYATASGGWGIKSLVVGLISQKLFELRMSVRKEEEFEEVKATREFFSERKEKKVEPMVWLVLDEAHEFLPNRGKTTATDALVTILREGRQPGISLILATQQPGKIHTDVMTQSDIMISHRITAKVDVEALGALMQSYMRKGLDEELNMLPRLKGSAIVFDDTNERIYPMQVRPRFTWHGGSAPTALVDKKEIF